MNPKVGNSTISNYSSKLEQAVEKLVWQQKIGIVKVRSTGESKHTTLKGCQNTKKYFFFIVMEQFFVQKNVFKNNIHTKLDINEEIFEAVLKEIFFIFELLDALCLAACLKNWKARFKLRESQCYLNLQLNY